MLSRDDIIRMAREADFAEGLSDNLVGEVLVWDAETKHLERFAALVAAAERTRMISEGWRQCAQGQRTSQFCAVAEQARLEERTRACRIVTGLCISDNNAREINEAIRAQAADRLARHGIQIPEDDHDGNPSF